LYSICAKSVALVGLPAFHYILPATPIVGR
jgi:hypothetical protein